MASSSSEDTLEYKKEKLYKHLPFVKKTVSKVANTTYEKKWKNTLALIMSEQGMSIEQVDQLDRKLEDLKASIGFSSEGKESRKSPEKEDRSKRNEARSSRSSNEPKQNGIKENDQKSPKKEQNAPATRSSPKSARSSSRLKDVSKGSMAETADTKRQSTSRQREESKPSDPEAYDLKHLLNSISLSEEQPEKSLEAIERILGDENLVKLQNLLLKKIIMKSVSETSSVVSKSEQQTENKLKQTEQQPTDACTENESQSKEQPKKKVPRKSDLEKLNEYNKEIYDGEDVLKVGQRMRACMLKSSEKISQCYEREKAPLFFPQYNRPAPASKKNLNLVEKYKLKKCSVVAVKLNITNKDVPLLVQKEMKEDYINENKSILKVFLDESFDAEKAVNIKQERNIQQAAATEEKVKSKPVNISSVAKKRVRNQWSRGMIKKRKRDRNENWTNAEKDKKKIKYVAGMNLDVDPVSNGVDMEIEEDQSIQKKTELSLLKSSDPLVTMLTSAGNDEKPLSFPENLDTSSDEENLLEEIPSSPETNADPVLNFAEKSENASNVSDKPSTLKEPSPAESEPLPKSKIGMIKLIPQARLMQPVPPLINVSDNENILSPPPKLIGITASPTTAIIRPIQHAIKAPINNFKIFSKPAAPQAQQIVIPNALQQLIRLDFLPKTGNAQIPQLINVPIPKNSQPIRRFSVYTPQQVNAAHTKSVQPSSNEARIPVHIIEKFQPAAPPRRMSLQISKPPVVFKQPDSPLVISQLSSTPSTSRPASGSLVPAKTLPKILPDKVVMNISNASSNNILRPWLDGSKGIKKRGVSQKMINNYCLAALYKCMATTCCFFTNDQHLFQMHVELHVKLQPGDVSNTLLCAYCNHVASTILGLIKHIEHEHKFDLFSCGNCFYRTYNEYQMYLNHYPKYHEGKEKFVIELTDFNKKQPRSDLLYIKNNLSIFVTPFSCIFPGCGKRYYVLEVFSEHLQSHKEKIATKCMKCSVETTPDNIFEHYFNCYGFGMIQCVYCSFGTSTMQFIDDHLSVNHPSRAPYFAERMLSSSMKSSTLGEAALSSSESLTIKIMSKKLEGGTKIQVTDTERLNNSQNVGNLTDEENEEQPEEPQITLAPGTNFQINSVMSLNQNANN